MIIKDGFEILEFDSFDCVKYGGDYWFTQRNLSRILNVAKQTINEHLIGIYKLKKENVGRLIFPVSNLEGTRTIKRKSLHFNIDNLFDITTRSKRFDEFNEALSKISQKNKVYFNFKVMPIKERNFKEILEKSLNGIEEFCYQHTLLDYKVDFFFPRLGLIVEFDETAHNKRLSLDIERQDLIEKETGYCFIRVDEGNELNGLNSILLFRERILNNSGLLTNSPT